MRITLAQTSLTAFAIAGLATLAVAATPFLPQSWAQSQSDLFSNTVVDRTEHPHSTWVAQNRSPHRGQWQSGASWDAGYGNWYNADRVETLRGEVVAVDSWTSAGGRGGMHVQLQTDQETLWVHLGPSWYLDEENLTIAPGDRLEVTGSRLAFNGEPNLIAGEVRLGDRTLQLRHENGDPVWRGQGECCWN